METAPTKQVQLVQTWTRRAVLMFQERLVVGFLFLSASMAALITGAIFLTLLVNGWDFFRHVPMTEFLFGREWAPDFPPPRFGVYPLLKGTLQIGLGAAAIGIPIGVGTAIYLSEFAPARARSILKPAIELLAGVPSIVFGVIALFVVSPILGDLFEVGVFSAANATIVLGIMVIPIISTLSEDAIRAVPRELREGALALGATRWEVTKGVVVPAASSGITAATILGFSRAIGETMVVTLAAGLVTNRSWNYLEPTQTITAYIANRAGGDLPTGSIEYLSIFAVGTVLFIVTFAFNILAVWLIGRQRRRFA